MTENKNIEEIFSKSVRSGRRTYFFDVRSTRAGDYYLTVTESKRDFNEDGTPFYKKHKLYLYKEDFTNFKDALNEVSNYIIKEKGEEIISNTKRKTEKITESGGEVRESKRSNVAKKGFTRRTIRVTEEIKSGDTTITLKHSPIKMGNVRGWVPAKKGKFKWRQIRNVTSISMATVRADIYALSGNTLTIGTDGLRNIYGAHPKTGAYFKVTYSYLDNYDPNYAGSDKK